MTVHFIGAGPGAADLITLRGKKLLEQCPVCLYAGSIIPKDILKFCSFDTQLIDSAPLNLNQIEAEFVKANQAGKDVARLHSGDLSVYSAVAEQIRRLEKHAIPYTLTPGVPAFAAAAAIIKKELTIPTIAQSIVLTRISGRASVMPEKEKLETYAQTSTTLIIHLAIHRIEEIVQRLVPFYGENCPIVIAAHISWPNEKIIQGTLATILKKINANPIQRTALIMVGPAMGSKNHMESALYNVNYQRRFKNQ